MERIMHNKQYNTDLREEGILRDLKEDGWFSSETWNRP
jgi:hypothetical protein